MMSRSSTCARAYPAGCVYYTELRYRIIRMHFDISGLVTSSNVDFTSLKVENGVVEVDDDEDDIAIDSKDTAVLRFVPATVTGLL